MGMEYPHLMRVRPMDYVLSMTPEEHEKALKAITSSASACSFKRASQIMFNAAIIAYLADNSGVNYNVWNW